MPTKTQRLSDMRQAGVNEPATSAASIDIRAQIEADEARRVQELERSYAKVLLRAINGDREAVKDVSKMAGQLNWSPERIGHDQKILSDAIDSMAQVNQWNTQSLAEFEKQSNAIRELEEQNRTWPNTYRQKRYELEAKRLPLLTQLDSVKEAKKRLRAMNADPEIRALLELAGLDAEVARRSQL